MESQNIFILNEKSVSQKHQNSQKLDLKKTQFQNMYKSILVNEKWSWKLKKLYYRVKQEHEKCIYKLTEVVLQDFYFIFQICFSCSKFSIFPFNLLHPHLLNQLSFSTDFILFSLDTFQKFQWILTWLHSTIDYYQKMLCNQCFRRYVTKQNSTGVDTEKTVHFRIFIIYLFDISVTDKNIKMLTLP